MAYDFQKSIDFLLENANPSIRLRVKKEILGNIAAEEETDLIAQIKEEPIYKLIASCQKENGWLGNGFHGPNKNAGPYENQEVGTKWLAEKALGKDDPVLKRAMDAFVTTELTDLCYRTKGKYFDEFRYAANGQNLIRCACIARAGYDDIIDIRPQIQLALDSFKRVLEVDSILDITRVKKVSGKETVPTLIHAGLECGLMSKELQGLEAISVGCNVHDLHTPQETMELDSMDRIYEAIIEVLK